MRTPLLALAIVAASLLQGQERTLRWKSLDVTAKLENDGTLRVSERHGMVFDGAWNGGERVFALDPGQQIVLLGVSAVVDGETFPMAEALESGILMREYRFDGRTLRWRARNPDDPPFRNEERTYVIDYLLRHVVDRNGEHYVLHHDFAFPERPGPIESFSAKLELDSLWQPPEGFVASVTRTNIPPGESVVLELQLQWTGEGQPAYLATPESRRAQQPASAPPPAPPAPLFVKLMALASFAALATLLAIHFLWREERVGRFAPPPLVTTEWLEEHLLVHRAEVVGAAWDGTTGQGEVAALIAIMTSEGKIENVAGAPKLRLLVPRESLSDYERGFVDALFVRGDEIDPVTLRAHYCDVGFQPAKSIAAPLENAARRLVGNASGRSWALGCIAALACFSFFPIMTAAFVLTLPFAAGYRGSLLSRAAGSALPVPLLLAGVLQTFVNTSLEWLIANLIAGALLLWIALRFASWRDSPLALQNFRNFRAAREFLLQRISRSDAEIDPRWIPYMLAFGLQPDDRWSVAAAQSPRRATTGVDSVGRNETPRQSSSASAHVAASVAPSFAAGGGSFGGAGATGSWASIQSFAAAVAPVAPRSSSSGFSGASSSGSGWSWSSSSGSSSRPSSSSSGGSSRGGGSRSGGGGGGGW